MINTKKMKSINKISINKDDKRSLYMFSKEAENFLRNKTWCKNIERGYFAGGFEGIIGIFFFEIEPPRKGVDKYLWVITGDIPPAYLVIDECKNAKQALNRYIKEMQLWVEAVNNNKPVDDVIPVNVPPRKKYAKMLESRLKFLREKILPEFNNN